MTSHRHNPSTSESDGRGSTGLHPLDWARSAGAEELVEREMRIRVRQRHRRRLIIGGTVSVVVLAFALSWRLNFPAPAASGLPPAPEFVSAPARQTLPDGSVVEYKGAARVNVDFSADLRRVVLREGEAHFQVTKNPTRPFVVVADGVEVRAVGTSFSVQLEKTGVEVLVTEGRVAVAALSSSISPGPILVDAGQGVSVATGGSQVPPLSVRSMQVGELESRLSWRVPQLTLHHTPLSAVLPVINAQTGSSLKVAESDLGEVKLSGSLRANNVPVLLQILESSYGIVAEHGATGEIVLRRKQ